MPVARHLRLKAERRAFGRAAATEQELRTAIDGEHVAHVASGPFRYARDLLEHVRVVLTDRVGVLLGARASLAWREPCEMREALHVAVDGLFHTRACELTVLATPSTCVAFDQDDRDGFCTNDWHQAPDLPGGLNARTGATLSGGLRSPWPGVQV